MHRRPLKLIEDAIFRANPDYELVLFDRLPPEQRDMLGGLRKDPDFYGVLRARGASDLGIKSVCRETALLYLTLREPGPLPEYVRAMLGDRCNREIAELVLDGVLEIERDGAFVARADAYEVIYGARPDVAEGGAIARLSREALKYAQALEIAEGLRLSARLYFYNRLPAGPEWHRRFPTPEAVAEHLGVRPGGPAAAPLDRDWSPVPQEPPLDGWLIWKRRRRRQSATDSRFTYKLYVSPRCEALREALLATVDAATTLDAPRFKVGKDVYGLLRPDKIVVYFDRFEEVKEAADRLRDRLDGCPAHGVPFTAELGDDGLLSWGTDPPRDLQALEWQERESWRLWLTNRLATALLAAKSARSPTVEPWQFALERVRLEGVDTQTWTPARSIWLEDKPERE
jgi:hypothetical protein